jgi:hypothetical protein
MQFLITYFRFPIAVCKTNLFSAFAIRFLRVFMRSMESKLTVFSFRSCGHAFEQSESSRLGHKHLWNSGGGPINQFA